jgi:hypothetical protein
MRGWTDLMSRIARAVPFMALAGILSLGLAPARGQDDPPVAQSVDGTLTVARSQVLDVLNRAMAPTVLEEIILASLVEQDARAQGIAPPADDEVDAKYKMFLVGIAADQGYQSDDMRVLVTAVNFERYFEDNGLTVPVVKRRLRTQILTDAILLRTTTLTPEELADGRVESVMKDLAGRAKRVVSQYAFETSTTDAAKRAKATADAEALLARVSKADYVPLSRDLVVFEEPAEDSPPDPLAKLAFSIPSEGACVGPVEIGADLVIQRLVEILVPWAANGRTEGMTPEQIAQAQAAYQQGLRDRAVEWLRKYKAQAGRAAYWARLRAENPVEVLWTPPAEATAPH